jgi:hypothetical protein
MDPVLQVALYEEKEKIQMRIRARIRSSGSMDVEKAQAPNPPESETISLLSDEENSCDSEATMPYPAADRALAEQFVSADQLKIEQSIKSKSVAKDPVVVPMTVQKLWNRVQQLPLGELEPPSCSNTECPYCAHPGKVPLMLQRYNLMQRLAQLEKILYGV